MKILNLFIGGHRLSNDDAKHMQEAYTEVTNAIIASDVPLGVTKCKLYGCLVTKDVNNYTMTAGAIWYDNEVFLVDAVTAAITDVGVPKFAIETSYPGTNPVQYKDASDKYVHANRKMKLTPSSDLSGLFVYTDVVDKKILMFNESVPVGVTWDVQMSVADVAINFDLTDPDLKGKSDRWKGFKINVAANGRVVVGYDPSDPDYNNPDGTQTGGLKNVELTLAQLAQHNHVDGSYNGLISADGAGTVSVATDTTDSSGSEPNLLSSGELQDAGEGEAHENRQPYIVYLKVIRI